MTCGRANQWCYDGGPMKIKTLVSASLLALLVLAGNTGCAGPLTQREQGGLIGGVAGMGTGAIIGSTVGHATAGALIGGPIGLIGGAVLGDQLMRQRQMQIEQQAESDNARAELERLRKENEQLRRDKTDDATAWNYWGP